MGYDQYTVRIDCSCRTYFCCFPLALANVSPWSLMPFLQISLENGADKTTHNTSRDCRVHFFPTTSLETTVYRAIKWKDLHDSDAAALLNDIKKIFWRTISKIRHFLMFHWMNHSPGSLIKKTNIHANCQNEQLIKQIYLRATKAVRSQILTWSATRYWLYNEIFLDLFTFLKFLCSSWWYAWYVAGLGEGQRETKKGGPCLNIIFTLQQREYQSTID